MDIQPDAPAGERPMNVRDAHSIRRRNYGSPDTRACTALRVPPSTSDSESESEGQDERPCICVGCLRHVLATRTLAADLAGHLFGHLVSIELTRDILTKFIIDGIVQVFENMDDPDGPDSETLIDPRSEDEVRRAVRQAFESAVAHDCIRVPAEENTYEEGPSSTHHQQPRAEKAYLFRWRTFPESFNGDEIVSFLNDIADRAFAFARSRCTTTRLKLQHRFASPRNHDVLLAYGLHEGVMRPDFFLLPIDAFTGLGFDTVDERYINFSALRLVGGLHEKYPRVGREKTREYAEALKGAQPWLFYTLGMTISKNMIVLSRDCGGWEHLALALWDPRGSIEFIRVLLGLVTADPVDLGQNPFIQLKPMVHTWTPAAVPIDGASDDDASITSSRSPSTNSGEELAGKRDYSEIEGESTGSDNSDEQSARLKRIKIIDLVSMETEGA